MYSPAALAPEGALASFERPIDLVHLARQTLGDRALEREVLELFVVQARSVLARLEAAKEERARLDLAHTLKGSARSVGAWRVAEAAEACELLVDASAGAWQDGLDRLVASLRDACMAIAEIHASH